MTITDSRVVTMVQRLKAARLFAGIEQTEIATDLGVSRQTVSAWENGKNAVPAAAMIRYAELCKVSLDWIAFGSVRPEGFEPPTYWSVASTVDLCPCEWDHESPFERCYCSCHGDPNADVRRSALGLAA